MGNKNIIIDIPFNIDLSPYMLPKNYIHPKLEKSYQLAQTDEWIVRRLELFMKYTYNSLSHQTNQNFTCLLRCTPTTEKMIYKYLREYPALEKNIYFTPYAQQIIDESIKQHGNLYRVVIDSDNMFHDTFIEQLHQFNHKLSTLTIISQEGYILDDRTKQVTRIFHPSPSFYAAIYNLETYQWLYQRRLFEKHWDAIKYPYEQLGGPNYCICTHDINVDNEFARISQKYGIEMIQGKAKEHFFEKWHLKME
ncbi:MAG: hypothetical protein J6F30_12875 [Cellulosilyticum sp.]|nr:hypothetical protein [Cellulosilyticum sp.]